MLKQTLFSHMMSREEEPEEAPGGPEGSSEGRVSVSSPVGVPGLPEGRPERPEAPEHNGEASSRS